MVKVNEENQVYPRWCELQRYAIHRLGAGEEAHLVWMSPSFKLVCARGSIQLQDGPEGTVLPKRGVWDAPNKAGDGVGIRAIEPTTVVALEGTWREETGGRGVFTVINTDAPLNRGDPANYPRTTSFDNHFHDCDEYWIIVDGEGTAMSEGIAFDVGPGDCIITGAGDHHDFPVVRSPILAVFFETTLLGQKRRGHLWEHTHGPAIPVRN